MLNVMLRVLFILFKSVNFYQSIFKLRLHGQCLCDNFYVTNISDFVDSTAIICQQFKVKCGSNDFGQQRHAETRRATA